MPNGFLGASISSPLPLKAKWKEKHRLLKGECRHKLHIGAILLPLKHRPDTCYGTGALKVYHPNYLDNMYDDAVLNQPKRSLMMLK